MTEYSTILIRNIYHMLCYAFKVLRQSNYQDIAVEDFRHVQDLLAAILVRGINQQLKQGLHRDYTTVSDQTPSLCGKLDPFETRLLQCRKMQKLKCTYDMFSADNIMNQTLKATCCCLIHCADVEAKQRIALRKVYPFFSDVKDIDLSSIHWNRLQFHRNNQSYEMLMNLCYMVWQSLLPTTTNGARKLTVFDEESLPRLYEKFILNYYLQHFTTLDVCAKTIDWDLSADIEKSTISLLPGMHSDVTLSDRERTLIIDAKFYSHALLEYMGKQMLHSTNVYQLYTYVKNEDKLNDGHVSGLLLYAKTTEATEPDMTARIGGNTFSVKSLDLNRPFRDISCTLDKIVRAHFGVELLKTD